MKTALLASFLLASTAFAQTREIFPSDYTPSACPAQTACESWTQVSFKSAATHFVLRTLESEWNDKHKDELYELVKPYCPKRATCLGSPGRMWWFCNDVYTQELRQICDRMYDQKTDLHNWEQCRVWIETYADGVDQHPHNDWFAAQACIKEKLGPAPPLGKMDWWMVPATIPIDYKGQIELYAIDQKTHVPVQAQIAFQDQILYSRDCPDGKVTAYYAFEWPRKLVRIPNADGHTDVLPAMMTLTAPGYEPVATRVPTPVPKMLASISAPLHSGKNKFVVTTTDESTGKPVEAQIFAGSGTIGMSNTPIELTVGKKKPEIWARSPFDAYSDVVVVK